jgi:hypothetical protein
MKVSRSVKFLSMLITAFTLIAVSAAPANAQPGFWWVGNSAGGCLDWSGTRGFRIFNECHGGTPFQWQKFTRSLYYGPDAYVISNGNASCLTAFGNGARASDVRCNGSTAQVWIIRDANNQPYFDSLGYASQHLCLTNSRLYDGAGGYLLTTEPCAGRREQFWLWLQFRP